MELTISVLFKAAELRQTAKHLSHLADMMEAPRSSTSFPKGAQVTVGEPEAAPVKPIVAEGQQTEPVLSTSCHRGNGPVEQVDLVAVFGTQTVVIDHTPTPKEPATDGEKDSAGVVWTKGIHADNKAKKQDGTWKTRRGAAKKMPTNNPGRPVDEAEIKTVQDAVGKLIGVGVEIPTIITAISQTVFSDLAKTEGGMEHILKTGDKKLAGRAMNALRAIAVANKTTV